MPEDETKKYNPTMHASDGISIRDYVDQRFKDSQRAIDKAEEAISNRLDGMNEFRDTLRDQAARFITREELGTILGKLQDNVNALQKLADIAEGKASMRSVVGAYALAIVGIIIAIIKAAAK